MNRYFKLDTAWDTRPWVQALSAEAQNVWIKLQCYIAAHGVGGQANALTPAYAARIWWVGEESVKQCLTAAQLAGMLDVSKDDWVLPHWRTDQGDPTGAERKRNQRARERDNQVHVTGVTRDGVTVTHKKKKKKREEDTKERETSVSPKKDRPSSLEEVVSYFNEKGSNRLEAEKFWYFYESKGWKVGKNPMQVWKMAASGWISRNGSNPTGSPRAGSWRDDPALAWKLEREGKE